MCKASRNISEKCATIRVYQGGNQGLQQTCALLASILQSGRLRAIKKSKIFPLTPLYAKYLGQMQRKSFIKAWNYR